MIYHLPECPMLHEQYPKHPLENCDYCNMLRACEQRVNGHRLSYENGVEVGYDKGYVAGLSAARDAVAALPHTEGWKTPPVGRVDLIDKWGALRAIDALKGDSDD